MIENTPDLVGFEIAAKPLLAEALVADFISRHIKAKGREQWLGEYEQLVEDFRSEDGDKRETARNLLRTYGLLDHSDEENIERLSHIGRVDIMERMQRFSGEEQTGMVQALTSIELTHGCSGGCEWCLFGLHSDVGSRFSFPSLQEFFTTYADEMNPDISLYADSDPLDYQDVCESGIFGFADVYKAFRTAVPDEEHYIRTAIPPGTTAEFMILSHFILGEQIDRYENDQEINVSLPISLARHNARRVQVALNRTAAFLRRHYTEDSVEWFFRNIVEIHPRHKDNIYQVGPQLMKSRARDAFRDINSPACTDGVVLSPSLESGETDYSFARSIVVTAATMDEPTGMKHIPLKPGHTLDRIPTYFIKIDMVQDYAPGKKHAALELPQLVTSAGSEWFDTSVDFIFSREAAHYAYITENMEGISNQLGILSLIQLISSSPQGSNDLFSLISQRRKKEFRAAGIFKSLADINTIRLVQTQELLKNDTAMPFNRELLDFWYQKAAFLIDLIKQYKHPMDISTAAAILNKTSSVQKDKLPALFVYLGANINFFSQSGKVKYDEMSYEADVSNVIDPIFDLLNDQFFYDEPANTRMKCLEELKEHYRFMIAAHKQDDIMSAYNPYYQW